MVVDGSGRQCAGGLGRVPRGAGGEGGVPQHWGPRGPLPTVQLFLILNSWHIMGIQALVVRR